MQKSCQCPGCDPDGDQKEQAAIENTILRESADDIINDMPNHTLLHRLWTKAVGTNDYIKAEWIELERRLKQ